MRPSRQDTRRPAWKTSLKRCESYRKKLWRRSILFQSISWVLAMVTTFIAIFQGEVEKGFVTQWEGEENASTKAAVIDALSKSTLLLPVLAALITTMTSKMLWRDKWSVTVMAASQALSSALPAAALPDEVLASHHVDARLHQLKRHLPTR